MKDSSCHGMRLWRRPPGRNSDTDYTLTTTTLSVEREATEDRDDFWSMSGDYVFLHHVAPRGQLHVPQESSFPIPPKYLDVVRPTWTIWKRVALTGFRMSMGTELSLSEDCIGFNRFQILNVRPPKSHKWVVNEWMIDQSQQTSRADSIWAEPWTTLPKKAKKTQNKIGKTGMLHVNKHDNIVENA